MRSLHIVARRSTLTSWLLVFGAALGACGRAERAPSMSANEADVAEKEESLASKPGGPKGGRARERQMPKRAPASPPPAAADKMFKLADEGAMARANAFGGAGAAELEASPSVAAEAPAAEAAPSRAWFPETFLFEPVVVTDANGVASVPVRVPDRLTTWRVLALAHSRDGAQAGAVTSFLGTLPIYVDPVLPGFFMADDEVRLPIQVVNTTDKEMTQPLEVSALGAQVRAGGTASVRVPAAGSAVEYVTLKLGRPGDLELKARLGSADAIEREVPIQPTGRPLAIDRGGTLAAPRTLAIEAPAELEPDGSRVRLLVYPGALALLRSELGASIGRGGVAADAYALLLAGKGEALLRSLGDEPDQKALRELAIVAGQRALRAARSADLTTATLLAEAALAHRDNPVLSRLGERMVNTVAAGQRPDGTFGGASGWTLQRLLVTTADALRAIEAGAMDARGKQRAIGAAIRAEGAIERNLERIEEGYTASAILASGAVRGALVARLQELVEKGIKQNEDGSRFLAIETGVVRADGNTPSEVEGAALAVLALEKDPKAAPLVADLGAFLLSRYSPVHGWGDGATNLLAVRAVLSLFKEPLPERIQIALEMDGRRIAEGVLEGRARREIFAVESEIARAAGAHRFTVTAEPPVPGLGFSLTLKGFLPWTEAPPSNGLELAIEVPKEIAVGKPVSVTLNASAPAGYELEIRHAIPAGAQLDTPTLDALVSAGTIRSFEAEDGAVTLKVPARQPGQTFTASYRVIPTLAGTLRSAASQIRIESRPDDAHWVPPSTWVVR